MQYARLWGMNKSIVLTLAAAALLPSCAYMQTNKSVEELGRRYKGTELKNTSMSLHRQGADWYIGSPLGTYEKSYPIIHDSILFKSNNAPSYTLDVAEASTVYYPISAGTAACLQRNDGYAETYALADEIKRRNGQSLSELPKGTCIPIKASVVDSKQAATIISADDSDEVPVINQLLSGITFCAIDIPGTLVYNVAIPFMAPFVFFSEFFSGE